MMNFKRERLSYPHDTIVQIELVLRLNFFFANTFC